MLAAAALAFSLTVRVYDAYGLSAEARAAARAAAERVLDDADVTVAWVECPCPAPVGAADLIVRLTASTPAAASSSLGFSYVDVDRRAGTLATVFADRVQALALLARVDEGGLLGRAMAHEIVHLLFGSVQHARTGLMRGEWTAGELRRNEPWDWTLSRDERTRLRQAIVRRHLEPPRPDAVVARLPSRPALPPGIATR